MNTTATATQVVTANAAQTPMGKGAEVATAPATAPTRCACGTMVVVNDEGNAVASTGCGAPTTRVFAPGHDAKLKGMLIRAGAEDHQVRLASGELLSPEMAASLFGFGRLVREGIARAADRAEAKAERQAKRAAEAAARAAAKPAKRTKVAKAEFAALLAEVVAEPKPEPTPATVTVMVGRWERTGTLSEDGAEFTYRDKGGNEITTRKFR